MGSEKTPVITPFKGLLLAVFGALLLALSTFVGEVEYFDTPGVIIGKEVSGDANSNQVTDLWLVRLSESGAEIRAESPPDSRYRPGECVNVRRASGSKPGVHGAKIVGQLSWLSMI